MVNVEKITPSNPNQTNLNKRSQDFKEERLRDAKDKVKEFTKTEEPGILFKFFVGSMLVGFLFVGMYLLTAFKLFVYAEFPFKLFFTMSIVGVFGYLITWLLIISRLFINKRDFSLLSLLCPPIVLLGVFSRTIREEVGVYLLFHFIFIILLTSGIYLMCINQNLTLGQLYVFMNSHFDLKDSFVDKLINSAKNFIRYFFGIDDPKYQK